MSEFHRELESLLNKHSMENASDTPDFILADFLWACLIAWNSNVSRREAWYGRSKQGAASTGGSGQSPVDPNTQKDESE